MKNITEAIFSFSNSNGLGNKAAIVYAGESTSYNDLHANVKAYTVMFEQKGIRQGDRVVVLVERSHWCIAFMLACLARGVVYCPLDPETPKKRFQLLYNRLQAKSCFIINQLDISLVCDDTSGIQYHHNVDDPAIIIHTSGSTGVPKAVTLSSANLIGFYLNAKDAMDLDDKSHVLNTAPFYFDASLFDILIPLLYGATVFLSPGTIMPKKLLAMIGNEKITHLTAIGSTLKVLADYLTNENFDTLRYVATGAEPVHPSVINKWLDACPKGTVTYWYGPSECTIACTVYKVSKENIVQSGLYPIGYPLGDTFCKILKDGDLFELNVGVSGELLISGRQVMLGYWGESERIACDDRFFFEGSEKYYCSGDIVIINDKGELNFIGRKDDSIKRNGYRINLNEVSGALFSEFGRYNPVAIDFEHRDRVFIGLCIESLVHIEQNVIDAIMETLEEQLPVYMRPDILCLFTVYPHEGSGKVSRRQIRDKIVAYSMSSYKMEKVVVF